jgi:hypothetical protein
MVLHAVTKGPRLAKEVSHVVLLAVLHLLYRRSGVWR